MPTSYHGFIEQVIEDAQELSPATILDIGIGFGKWGHLFREYLDVFRKRVYKNEWVVRIDGIEIFEQYITEHQREVYDDIYIGNALEILPTLRKYHLVYAGDIIEHLNKEQGKELIRLIREHSRVCILCIPLGDKWKQGAMYGNEHEEHLASWFEDDFDKDEVTYIKLKQGSGNRVIGLIRYDNKTEG